MRKYRIIREITLAECPWLWETLGVGQIVHEYLRNTFGCISSGGVAVTFGENKKYFFELPRNALKKIKN